jgi:hypothetical protein
MLHVAKMFIQSKRPRTDEGNTLRNMWSPHWIQAAPWQVFQTRVLLPKAASDAADLVQKCENYQKCARDQKQPSSLTQLIQPTWPLQRWGLDLLGPLPPAQGNPEICCSSSGIFFKMD